MLAQGCEAGQGTQVTTSAYLFWVGEAERTTSVVKPMFRMPRPDGKRVGQSPNILPCVVGCYKALVLARLSNSHEESILSSPFWDTLP